MIVISDTSPLIALFNINKVEILHSLYGKIIIPSKVIGTLGILIDAKRKGLIANLSEPLEELKTKIGFRLHKSLIEKAKLIVGE